MYIVKDILHYCNTSGKCGPIPRHTIEYYDLTFVINGSMTYYINGKQFVLEKNDAILLPPGTVRERTVGKEKIDLVSFNFKTVNRYEINVPIYMKKIITSDIKRLVNMYPLRCLSTQYYSKEKLCNVLNYILFEIFEAVSFESNNPDIIKILKYIDMEINKHITLKMLSEHVNLSEEYISHIFKKNVGKNVIEYINERKMIIAKQMITEKGISLKEISEFLGFENYGYFCRVFKKYYKTSPSKIKNT